DYSAAREWGTGGIDYRVLMSKQPERFGFRRHWQAEAQVPWLYNPATRVWISYDDPESVERKAEYVRRRGLGGVMFWELGGDDGRLVDLGIRLLKIHPPHQGFPANAYSDGLEALGAIYRRCEERGLPVMIHTGTSVFPGARSKYGNPMELDDVAIDFPDLPL